MTPGLTPASSRTKCSTFYSLFSHLLLLAVLFCAPASGASEVKFLFPLGGESFYYNDIINITYTIPSEWSKPILNTWCSTNNGASVRFISEQDVVPVAGSVLYPIGFTSSENCWFNLKPSKDEKGGNTGTFTVLQSQREATTVGLPTPGPAPVATQTGQQQQTTTTLMPVVKITTNLTPSSSTTSSAASSSSTGDALGAAGAGSAAGDSPQFTVGSIIGVCIGTAALATILGGAVVAICLSRRKKVQSHSQRRWYTGTDVGDKTMEPPEDQSFTSRPYSEQDNRTPAASVDWQPSSDSHNSAAAPLERQPIEPWGPVAATPPVTASHHIGHFAAAQMSLSVPDFHSERNDSSFARGVPLRLDTARATMTSGTIIVGADFTPRAHSSVTPASNPAELPSKFPHLVTGWEQEMPISAPHPNQRGPLPGDAEPPSQKFMVEEVGALKTQRGQIPRFDVDPGKEPWLGHDPSYPPS